MNVLAELQLSPINSATYCARQGWHKVDNTSLIDVINPASEKVIARVGTCNHEDYQSVIQSSVEAFEKWRTVPAPKRGEVIRRIGLALRQHKSALGSLVAMEMGKIKPEADGEVQEMIDMADMAVGQSRMLFGNTMHSERASHRMYEQWQPLGPVGVISAFNFPVAVWSWNAFLAAVCGNSVIWKPSSKVPLSAIAVQHICNSVLDEMGYAGVFSLFLPQNRQTAQAFVEDPRIPLMSFTGSSGVGHYVAESVAKRMGKSILECSGNNGIIVDETANLDLALPAVVFGAVGTAGQRCTSTRRLFIHDSVFDTFTTRLIHAYRQVTIGDPLEKNTLMGPLIDRAAVENYQSAIAAAQQQGGRVLYGGNVIGKAGYFVEPTLIEMDRQSDIVKEETFAPILYLMRYSSLDEAIRWHNDVPQGLSSAIFTNHLQHAERFLSAVGSDCGIANVNIGTSGAEIGGAFGGEKQTGGGREAGSDCWKAYMRRQTNTINWGTELPLAQGIEFHLPK